jgi:hypothetical protein
MINFATYAAHLEKYPSSDYNFYNDVLNHRTFQPCHSQKDFSSLMKQFYLGISKMCDGQDFATTCSCFLSPSELF